jgi:hypothetical protein
MASERAAALIIVLAFVAILAGLSVAYLSVTTTDRQLAHSSFHDTAADLLARSALDIVIGDLKQEMVNGSNVIQVSGSTVYIPQTLNNINCIVPMRNGNPFFTGNEYPNDPIPNLIRRSVYAAANPAPPIVPSRASAVSSAPSPSPAATPRRGDVTCARWNSHYLIPKANTGDNKTDPVAAFTAPDWVIVTRAGPTPFPVWNSALKDPAPANTTYAVGRYAYAVYDEGGLLDINVAGYPTSTGAPTVTDIGRKGVPAFADLTALPTTPGNFLSTAAINKFILFRNYATMGSTDTLGSDITPAQAVAFVDYYLGKPPQTGTTQDFGQVNTFSSNASGSVRTDQNFITRAALIDFVKSTDIPFTGIVNTLQYLGTFSREQNKPNFQLTTTVSAGFTRVVLPQRFYLGNLNEVHAPAPTPPGTPTPTPTATPTPILTTDPIRTYFGLELVTPTLTVTPNPSPCDNQVRWKYVGHDPANHTPLSSIPAFPSDLTTLDFFQYINYALFGVTTADSTHCPLTLQRGASIIDQYDSDALATGIYFNPGSNPDNCDPLISACITFGADSGSMVQPPLSCVVSASPTPPTAANVFLNGPLRSVGEFSYAYSMYDATQRNNSPYYFTNFKEKYKAGTNPDPALLDFFTYNSAPVRSGIVSLNTRQPPVLAALLKGAIYKNSDSSVVSNSDATTAAKSMINLGTNKDTTSRALSRADIGNLAKTTTITNSPFTNDDGTGGTSEARETIARALAEVVQTRTWGLLIDLVAQTGHYKPNATGLADFIVEGEKRYWLHIAIDRFDGTIVDQELEEVTE